MELAQIILCVSGVLLLAFAWPAWRRQRRQAFQQAEQREHQIASQHEQQWGRSGLQVSDLARRLEGVRHDYLAEVQARECSRNFQASLLATARQTISRLAFFARTHPEDEHHNNAA
jgi:hypothetical protein